MLPDTASVQLGVQLVSAGLLFGIFYRLGSIKSDIEALKRRVANLEGGSHAKAVR